MFAQLEPQIGEGNWNEESSPSVNMLAQQGLFSRSKDRELPTIVDNQMLWVDLDETLWLVKSSGTSSFNSPIFKHFKIEAQEICGIQCELYKPVFQESLRRNGVIAVITHGWHKVELVKAFFKLAYDIELNTNNFIFINRHIDYDSKYNEFLFELLQLNNINEVTSFDKKEIGLENIINIINHNNKRTVNKFIPLFKLIGNISFCQELARAIYLKITDQETVDEGNDGQIVSQREEDIQKENEKDNNLAISNKKDLSSTLKYMYEKTKNNFSEQCIEDMVNSFGVTNEKIFYSICIAIYCITSKALQMKYAIKVNELDKENRIHTLIDDVEANLADAEHMKFNVILTPQITTTNSHFKNTFTHPQPQEWTNYLQVLGATCHLKTNVDGKPNTFEYDNDGAFKRNKEKYLKCKERLIVQHRLWNLFVSDSTCEQLDNEQIAEVNPSSVLDHIANEAKILATYRCYEQFLATKVGDGNEGITDKELQQAKQAYDRQGVEQLRSICDNGISLIPIDNNISDEKQRKRIQELNQQFMELLSKYIKRADEMSALSLQHPSQDLSMKHT